MLSTLLQPEMKNNLSFHLVSVPRIKVAKALWFFFTLGYRYFNFLAICGLCICMQWMVTVETQGCKQWNIFQFTLCLGSSLGDFWLVTLSLPTYLTGLLWGNKVGVYHLKLTEESQETNFTCNSPLHSWHLLTRPCLQPGDLVSWSPPAHSPRLSEPDDMGGTHH